MSLGKLDHYSIRTTRLAETERLMSAIGLEIEPAQLKFHERGTVPATPSYAQVVQPLNETAVGRWKNFASELESVLPIVGDAMSRGHYAF